MKGTRIIKSPALVIITLHAFDTMKILIIEDDNETRDYVSAGLKEAGHTIDSAKDGYEGLLLAKEGNHDLLIVDRMLPDLDGLTLVKTLRSAGCNVPILFLTSMCGIDDRVEGLNAGADDYLVKPFAFSELSARVNALLRRPRSLSENADEELAFPLSFHGITPNRPTTTLKHTIQTICYGIMATNNVI
jgi:DNA-binding response OmpR family regulator